MTETSIRMVHVPLDRLEGMSDGFIRWARQEGYNLPGESFAGTWVTGPDDTGRSIGMDIEVSRDSDEYVFVFGVISDGKREECFRLRAREMGYFVKKYLDVIL